MKISTAFFVVIGISISLSVFITGTISYIGTLKLFENENLQKNQIIISQFANSISNDLLSASNVEVFKKCQIFLSHNSISEVKISSIENEKFICNLKKQTDSTELNSLHHTVYYDDQNTIPAFLISANFSNNNLRLASKFIFLLSLFSTFLSLMFGSYFAKQLSDKLMAPIIYLAKLLKNGNLSEIANLKLNSTTNKINEIKLLFESTKEMSNKLLSAQIKVLQITKINTIAEVASQVAHDIRSPLAALNMITRSLNEVPEDKRLMIRNSIQRINDIANDLLTKGKLQKNPNDIGANIRSPLKNNIKTNPEVILLPALIDSLVSEKRIQYREQIQVQIQFDFKNSFGDFVLADSKELMRVLSNLINNSVEAFENRPGEVIVSTEKIIQDVPQYSETKKPSDASIVLIRIKDNGKGIPPNILERLGQQGVSHGKEGTQSGNGIGVYHAKKTIEDLGGEFKILSQVGIGTEIQIILPRTTPPIWFLNSLNLSRNSQIFALDDDISIHQIWKGRLSSLNASENQIYLKSFTSADEFKKILNSSLNISNKNQFYLIDYELLSQNTNGLKIIEELGLKENVTLVTSRYEEPQIQNKCTQLGIKLLPKQLAGFVPIIIENAIVDSTNTLEISTNIISREFKTHTNHNTKYDWVLIDDDPLVQMTWKIMSQEKQKKFIGFNSYKDFTDSMKSIDPSSKIYIDSNLGDGLKGEEIAKQIYSDGYKYLYIATGYEADHFKNLDYIQEVIGKEPPP